MQAGSAVFSLPIGGTHVVKKIALCIGLNTYGPQTTVTPLRGCVNDALLIGQMLRQAGFEVRQVHNEAAT